MFAVLSIGSEADLSDRCLVDDPGQQPDHGFFDRRHKPQIQCEIPVSSDLTQARNWNC
jgi:hypothetical protein